MGENIIIMPKITSNPQIHKCKCGSIFWDFKQTGQCPHCADKEKEKSK
jgi:anaerobic ribonucleoside-triphosphate reductase